MMQRYVAMTAKESESCRHNRKAYLLPAAIKGMTIILPIQGQVLQSDVARELAVLLTW